MATSKQRVDAALRRGDLDAALLVQAEKNVSARVTRRPLRHLREPSVMRTERRRKERMLKKREEDEAKGIVYVQLSDGRWRIACKGTNLYNEPCRQIVLRKGTVLKAKVPGIEDCVATGGFCLQHDEKVSEEYLKAIRSKCSGRKRSVVPEAYLQEVMTEAMGLFMRPYFKGLGIQLNPNTGEVTRKRGGGVKIHGESKEGDINMTDYDDWMSQAKLSEMLLDRGFGRPRTQAEVSFTPTGQVTQIPPTAERAREVALVLAEAEAIPTDDDTEEDE